MYDLYAEGDLILENVSLERIQQELREIQSEFIRDEEENAEKWPQDYVGYDYEEHARQYILDVYSVRQVVDLAKMEW